MQHVNVITYNMGMGIDGRDSEPVIDSKQEAFDLFAEQFCEEFKKDPDSPWFICVQEIHRKDDKTHPSNQVDGMQERLKNGTSRAWYKNSSTPINTGQEEAVAIFSNYDLEKEERWSLPGDSLDGKIVVYDRTALAVDVKIPWGRIGVVVTHLIRPGKDHDGSSRKESIQRILTNINEKFGSAIPVIVCGDMNIYDTTSPEVYYDYDNDDDAKALFKDTIGKMLKAGYTRGKNFVNPPQEAITHHAWNPECSSNTWGIFDYILVREVSCIAQYPTMPPINFYKTKDDGKKDYASDHKGMRLTINPGNIEWGGPDDYDTGSTLAVALDDNDTVVEVHRGAKGDNVHHLYYKVGTLNDDKTIAWEEIDGDKSQYKNDGFAPAVALDNYGNVVELHCDIDHKNRHYYKIGKLNTERRITWKDSVRYNDNPDTDRDTGSQLTVALDNSGNVVEMHCGSDDNKQTLSYLVGKFDVDADESITWEKSVQYAGNYNTGSLFAVALDNRRNVVGVHCGSDDKLYYRIGTLNDNKTITWGGAVEYGTGSAVAVALNDNGKVVEAHCESGDNEHTYYYRTGRLNNDKTITWETSIPYDYNTGASFGVALNNSGKVVEVHRGGGIADYGDTEDTHFCRAGQLN